MRPYRRRKNRWPKPKPSKPLETGPELQMLWFWLVAIGLLVIIMLAAR